MRRKTRIIQITGIRGILLAVLTVTCLAAGFIAFPGIVAMHIWNYVAEFVAVPVINAFQGVLLWAIVAVAGIILNDRKKFLVSVKTPDRLSEKEIKAILENVKSHSNMTPILKKEIKSVENTQEKDKENV